MSQPPDIARTTDGTSQYGWQSVSNAPFNLDLELAVIDPEGPHALVFACRRILQGWVKTKTNERVNVQPTHWRQWKDAS